MNFHELTVTGIQKTTRHAVVLTLEAKDVSAFEFTQGQYLTFRKRFDGEELRRCYSICSAKESGQLQVGIKAVAGGAFSTWANEELKVGDTLEALPPMGKFYTAGVAAGFETDGEANREAEVNTAHKHDLLFAAGSGITPILSILRTGLQSDPSVRYTLIYGNSNPNTIMFREELEDLKNEHLGRFNLLHVLTDDSQDIELFKGRLTRQKCADLFEHWVDMRLVRAAYICGPEPMTKAVSAALKIHGLPEKNTHQELFSSAQPGRAKQRAVSASEALQGIPGKVTLGGETRSLTIDSNQSLLDAALSNSVDAPYACRAGVCSTCIAKIIEGEVEMVANHALQDDEVNAGYVLTCQCYPTSAQVVWDYDQAGH